MSRSLSARRARGEKNDVPVLFWREEREKKRRMSYSLSTRGEKNDARSLSARRARGEKKDVPLSFGEKSERREE